MNKIKYIFSLVDYEDLYNNTYSYNSACKLLAELVDKRYICSFTLKYLDTSIDKTHFGPKSNRLFAEKLIDFYDKIYIRN